MKKNIYKVLSVMCSVAALSGVLSLNSASAMDGKETNPNCRRSAESSLAGEEIKRTRTDEIEASAEDISDDSDVAPDWEKEWLENMEKSEELGQQLGYIHATMSSIYFKMEQKTSDTNIANSYGVIDVLKFMTVCVSKLGNLYYNHFKEDLFRGNDDIIRETAERMFERGYMSNKQLCMLVSFVDSVVNNVETKISATREPEIKRSLHEARREFEEYGNVIKDMAKILDVLLTNSDESICYQVECIPVINSILEKMRPDSTLLVNGDDIDSLYKMKAVVCYS